MAIVHEYILNTVTQVSGHLHEYYPTGNGHWDGIDWTLESGLVFSDLSDWAMYCWETYNCFITKFTVTGQNTLQSNSTYYNPGNTASDQVLSKYMISSNVGTLYPNQSSLASALNSFYSAQQVTFTAYLYWYQESYWRVYSDYDPS